MNFKYLINEFATSAFQVNRGLLFTIKEFFTKPDYSIRQFLKGKRKQHFKPLVFVLLTSTIYVLLMLFTGKNTDLGNALSGMADGLKTAPGDKIEFTFMLTILNWLTPEGNQRVSVLHYDKFHIMAGPTYNKDVRCEM